MWGSGKEPLLLTIMVPDCPGNGDLREGLKRVGVLVEEVDVGIEKGEGDGCKERFINWRGEGEELCSSGLVCREVEG